MSEYLPDSVQGNLRLSNIIEANEVAIKAGDIFFAENVLTKERRIINVTQSQATMTEGQSERKLLKD